MREVLPPSSRASVFITTQLIFISALFQDRRIIVSWWLWEIGIINIPNCLRVFVYSR
jgi:hypothetical protein